MSDVTREEWLGCVNFLLDAAKFLEVVEELLALVALRLAVLHRIAAQIVVQLNRFDGGRS